MSEPTLQYLIPVRDVAYAPPAPNGEIILIRPFDTVLIPKGEKSVTYSFYVVGRVFLNTTGLVNAKFKVKLLDIDGKEVIPTSLLPIQNASAELGINIQAYLSQPKFEKIDKYSIEVEVSIGDGEFKKIGSPAYFQVKELS